MVDGYPVLSGVRIITCEFATSLNARIAVNRGPLIDESVDGLAM